MGSEPGEVCRYCGGAYANNVLLRFAGGVDPHEGFNRHYGENLSTSPYVCLGCLNRIVLSLKAEADDPQPPSIDDGGPWSDVSVRMRVAAGVFDRIVDKLSRELTDMDTQEAQSDRLANIARSTLAAADALIAAEKKSRESS